MDEGGVLCRPNVSCLNREYRRFAGAKSITQSLHYWPNLRVLCYVDVWHRYYEQAEFVEANAYRIDKLVCV